MSTKSKARTCGEKAREAQSTISDGLARRGRQALGGGDGLQQSDS